MTALSVVIATHARARSLAGVLTALSHLDPIPDMEVIVTENGAHDATGDVCHGFAKSVTGLRHLHDPRPGQLVGWHLGLAAAQGEVIAFIDDDIRPEPGWAAAIADAFADPALGLATGPIRARFDTPPPAWHRQFLQPVDGGGWSPLWGALDLGAEARTIPSELVWGSNFIVRRTDIVAVGGFHPAGMPPELFLFTGDAEIHAGRAVASLGRRVIYVPGAAVVHQFGAARFGIAELERRFYGEGVVNSYQRLRAARMDAPDVDEARLTDLVSDSLPADALDGIGADYLVHVRELEKDGLSRLRTAGRRGFEEHQAKFATDAAFRRWVLRPYYLDLNACYSHQALAAAV